MIRKDDGSWYFKGGAGTAEIFKIIGNKTPSMIDWSRYWYNETTGKYQVWTDNLKYYDSEIQYMVIPKMPLRIE